MPNFASILKCLYYGLSWGWNPTKTQYALRLLEEYFNHSNQKEFPKIRQIIQSNPEFQTPEFINDNSETYDLDILATYPDNSLGREYADFMRKLGFKPLALNLQASLPVEVRSMLYLAVKNHDLIHLLFQLYNQDEKGQIDITDFHEYVFLSLTANSHGNHFVPHLMLFMPRLKAILKGKYAQFRQAVKLGKYLSTKSVDLNLVWLTPHLKNDINQVRQKLNIITLSEAKATLA